MKKHLKKKERIYIITMCPTTIYKLHTADKVYVYSREHTPIQTMIDYVRDYAKNKKKRHSTEYWYGLFEKQIPEISIIEEYKGPPNELNTRVEYYRKKFNCVTLNRNNIKIQKHKPLSRRNLQDICECGSKVSRGNMKRHMKTKKHQNYIKE